MSNMFKKTNRYWSLILVFCMMLNIIISLPVLGIDTVLQTKELENIYDDSNDISPWAIELVKEATAKEFITGADGKFNPKDNVTRAEFIKIMVNILDIDTNIDKAINFSDVTEKDWSYPYINAGFKAGIIKGEGNKFNPNDNITHEQMAVIIVRSFGLEDKELDTKIKDIDKVSSWARKDVGTIIASGLMTGNNENFNPTLFATREMSVASAMRGYNYEGKIEILDKDNGIDGSMDQVENLNLKEQIKKTAIFMQKTVKNPTVSSVGGEWTVLGLARSGEMVPNSYYDNYCKNVEKVLREKDGELHRIKYTEYDRVILTLTSIGRDVKNVAGYDLTKALVDFNTLIKQGINGPIFALIALDSKEYEIPEDHNIDNPTTREMLIDFILDREIEGGGWALGQDESKAESDITGMAIQGLSPYYHTNNKVKNAVDRAINWLSKDQQRDGSYGSWSSSNSESIAQVVVALTSLGIDPHNDPRFIKNGNSAIDALLSFGLEEGGFYHVMPGGTGNGGAKPGQVDLMATDQAMHALVAYDRFVNGQNPLYDMTDVK